METNDSGKHVKTAELKRFIANALEEDVRDGDHSSLACIPADARGKARLLVKEDGVIAGLELAEIIFRQVDPSIQIEMLKEDGDLVQYGDEAFYVEGPSRSLLVAERLVLNCMQRMSAIATKTRYYADLIKEYHTCVLDTRKTTPGLRMLEKWAVRIGGGTNHRFGLYDMIMLKDNHIDFAGGIAQAIAKTKAYLEETELKLKIEVEARDLAEVEEILAIGGIDRIMLDNFNFEDTRTAVKRINGRVETESSGGITEKTIADYAACGVDYISVGAITHSVYNMDLSLKAME
jgi:nicotinate-nucleotide pyrophosphorylase (carboxylating)